MDTKKISIGTYLCFLGAALFTMSGCYNFKDKRYREKSPPGPGAEQNEFDKSKSKKEFKDAGVCSGTKNHTGLGNRQLDTKYTGKTDQPNRTRLKPFSVYAGEYRRILKSEAIGLREAQSTFGDAPDRWFDEPESSAVALITLFTINYNTALRYIQQNKLSLPEINSSSAKKECENFQSLVWDTRPIPAQVEACEKFILNDTVSESNTQKRWAYGFASVLTTAGFLTY